MSRRSGSEPAPAAGSSAPRDIRPTTGVVGVVLCGGRSRRMGFDKGAALLAGRSLVERAAGTLAQVTERVVLACGSEPRYAELGLPLVLDDATLVGPAAGIVAALEDQDARWALVLACDMPRIAGPLLAALLERAREGDLDACLLASARGEEPLCGVYARAIVPWVRAAQRSGRLRVTGFRDFGTEDGGRPRLAAFGSQELSPLATADPARNLNTPGELELERQRVLEEGRP